jgi:hypothetical protein
LQVAASPKSQSAIDAPSSAVKQESDAAFKAEPEEPAPSLSSTDAEKANGARSNMFSGCALKKKTNRNVLTSLLKPFGF